MNKYFIILLMIFLSCKKNNVINNSNVDNNIPVKVSIIEIETENVIITTHGLLTTGQQTFLSFTIPGIIQETYVKDGDRVYKGQVLAKLDYTEISAQENQVLQSYEKAQRDYKRMKNLYKDGVISLEELQNSKTAFDVTRESLNTIVYNKNHAQIKAPSDGVILQKMANKGEYINSGMPVYIISKENSEGFIIKSSVSASDWKNIKEGDNAKIQIEGYPSHNFSGRIKHINQYLDKKNGLYSIDIQVFNENMKMTEGMFAKVDIISNQIEEYSVVPIKSIVERDGNNAYIYIPNNKDHVKKIPVTISFVKDKKVYISNLHGVDSVISDGAGFLSEFSTITIKK